MTEMDAVSGLSQTAQRVVEAAALVIEEHGEAGVRVQEIAHEVGVAVTSIYRFFGSRDGLVEAAQAHRYAAVLMSDLDRFEVEAQKCSSAEDVVHLIDTSLEHYLTDDRAHVRMVRANALGSAQSRPRLAAALARVQAEYNDRLAAALRPLQERGWLRADLELISTSAWVAGALLSRLLVEIGPTGADRDRWNAYTRRAFHALLLPNPVL